MLGRTPHPLGPLGKAIREWRRWKVSRPEANGAGGTRLVLSSPPSTRGVVFIHSCPRAYCPHVEWALTGLVGERVNLDWTPQSVAKGSVRAELSWAGKAGTAAAVASALRSFPNVRYEVTEEPTATTEGERYAVTPTLGVYRALIGPHGDVMLTEDRIRQAIVRAAVTGEPVEDELALLLGEPWDVELEPFRVAGEGAPVRWLHRVG
jgi:hypothetical protein